MNSIVSDRILVREIRKDLFKKTNYHASVRIFFVFSLIIINGYLIYSDNALKEILIFFQSIFLISLFAPLHECSHYTAFKTKRMNKYKKCENYTIYEQPPRCRRP